MDSYLKPGYCNSSILSTKKNLVFSFIKMLLSPIIRVVKYYLIKIIIFFRKDYQGVVYIDPKIVKYTVNRNDSTLKKNNMWHFGKVSEGNWDTNGDLVQTYGNTYLILKKRIHDLQPLDDINEFKDNIKSINMGHNVDCCLSEDQYKKKWVYIEKLFNLIKENGYKSQNDLKSGYPFNEIRVQVGRTGELFFEEGIHRLIITQVLNIKKIPVLITRRHKKWVSGNSTLTYKKEKNENL